MVQSILRKNKSLYLTYREICLSFAGNMLTYIQSIFIIYSVSAATQSVTQFPGPDSLGSAHKKKKTLPK